MTSDCFASFENTSIRMRFSIVYLLLLTSLRLQSEAMVLNATEDINPFNKFVLKVLYWGYELFHFHDVGNRSHAKSNPYYVQDFGFQRRPWQRKY